MSTGWFVYLAIGAFLVYMEHRLVNEDKDETLTTREKVLGALQLIIHYSRFALVWPWYMAEEFVLKLYRDSHE